MVVEINKFVLAAELNLLSDIIDKYSESNPEIKKKAESVITSAAISVKHCIEAGDISPEEFMDYMVQKYTV